MKIVKAMLYVHLKENAVCIYSKSFCTLNCSLLLFLLFCELLFNLSDLFVYLFSH